MIVKVYSITFFGYFGQGHELIKFLMMGKNSWMMCLSATSVSLYLFFVDFIFFMFSLRAFLDRYLCYLTNKVYKSLQTIHKFILYIEKKEILFPNIAWNQLNIKTQPQDTISKTILKQKLFVLFPPLLCNYFVQNYVLLLLWNAFSIPPLFYQRKCALKNFIQLRM